MPSTLKNYKLLEQEDESVAVRRLQTGLKELGYFSGNVTSYFGSKTYDSVRKFQRAKGLTVTGKADIATQRLLFSLAPDAEDIEVIEKINWFNEAKNLFKIGTTAKIIDVTTGRSFTVKRTGGYNHADVEPISASDTATMKKMLGSWSWNRRPIIVVYNGRYLAASMNGMPHSFDKVSGNNFSGHFCIHFARLTTNNRMELMAVCVALEALKFDGCDVTIYSDSKYVVEAVNQRWVFGWEKKGFAGKKNPDLWMRFLRIYRRHNVRFVWVKGHADTVENNRCDQLAVAAANDKAHLSEDTGYEPEER